MELNVARFRLFLLGLRRPLGAPLGISGSLRGPPGTFRDLRRPPKEVLLTSTAASHERLHAAPLGRAVRWERGLLEKPPDEAGPPQQTK